ncbi:MAG: hypothetical protein CHACPFDD_00851 [Phycisphaerae bacterium]|nr:hypothetical protein [Phycisphaerae bacterium]
MKRSRIPQPCIVAVWLTCLCPSHGEDFEIGRWTIDGGGGLTSAGGTFELSGTIGQADAGTLTGDGLSLAGGFWCGFAPGDCDSNGRVDLVDFAGFAACVTGPDAPPPLPDACRCFDLDRDEDVDLHDFAVFQVQFGT